MGAETQFQESIREPSKIWEALPRDTAMSQWGLGAAIKLTCQCHVYLRDCGEWQSVVGQERTYQVCVYIGSRLWNEAQAHYHSIPGLSDLSPSALTLPYWSHLPQNLSTSPESEAHTFMVPPHWPFPFCFLIFMQTLAFLLWNYYTHMELFIKCPK